MSNSTEKARNSSNFRIMSKRFSFELKITGILLVVLTLVALTGIFAYQRFTGVVSKINDSVRPDMRLLTAKALINEINDAEISVKSFRITEDTIYLKAFYHAAENIEEELKVFNALSTENVGMDNTTSLDSLIVTKIRVLDDLLFLQEGFRTEKALDKVTEAIENNVSENTADDQKPLLGWLFKRKKTVIPKTDTLFSLDEISEEVRGIKFEERKFKTEFRKQELELIIKDQILSDELDAFFDELEASELEKFSRESKEAEDAITRTNQQIALFCAVTGLLVLLMAFIIINYVHNNNIYRKALKKAKEEAVDLAKIKQKFLDNMSHEIRTPMNAIAGFSEQIGQGPLNETQRDQLKMVQKSTDHLLYLINEVLDLSKLHADKIKLEKIAFNPLEIIEDISKTFQNEAELKKLEITTEIINKIPDVLIGDPFRLNQILYNLIGNAIKFTDAGNIRIAAQSLMTNHSSCTLRIIIEDTGIGIEEKNLTKIFKEFEQAEDSTTRKYGGSGLGLTIVKQLIELHGGSINVNSEINKGTRISVDISYEIGNLNDLASNAVKINTNNYQFDNLKILIVDDEPYNRLLIISILKKFNIKYTEATNGEEALFEHENNAYDIILMDIRMPLMDGYETTKIIRKNTNSDKNNIPIIALTAAVSVSDKERYKKVGMNGFLAKPFKENELLSVILSTLNLKAEKSENPKEIKAESEEVIDTTALKNLSGEDVVFYREMLVTFNKGTQTGFTKIGEALITENWDSMAEYAHKISSPCNHLGATKLYELLKTIEHNCRNKVEIETIPALVAKMKNVGKLVIEAVEKELSTLNK